jgi:hypothetical protein
MMLSSPRRPWLLALSLLTLVLAACGGSDEDVTGGVASVNDLGGGDAVAAASELEANGDSASLTAEEAGLALSACMRDAGHDDFPDATVDENGRLNLRDILQSTDIDLRDEAVRSQLDNCRDEVGADSFGVGGAGGDRGGIEEALLGFTECLRQEGLDVGDITFGQPGAGAGAGAGQTGDGQGQPRGQGGAGGDRSGRIAGQLGLDADDPTTAAALDSCQGALDEAFAGIGGVGGGTPPTSDS